MMNTKKNTKNIKFSPPTQDTLQNALMFLMVYYKKKHGLVSLLTGLPLKDGMLTAQLFIRAVKRGGISARVVDRKAEDISEHTLPATVYMKNGIFAILTKIDDEGQYHTVDMKNGKSVVYKTAAFFDQMYGGFTILTKPAIPFEMLKDNFTSGTEWFWSVLKQFKKLYIQVVVASVIINFMGLVTPLFVMNVYDRVVPNLAFETLWVLAIGATVAFAFDFIFRQLRAYFIDAAGKGADILLASRLYEQVVNCRLGTRNSSSGAFANQLREFETLRDFFTSTTLVTLVDVPFVFIFIFILFLIGGPIALVPLLAVPLILFISYFVQLPLQGIIQQANMDMDSKHGHLVETINGLETIKALGIQSYSQSKWEAFVGQTARLSTKARFMAQLGVHASVFIQQLVYVLVVVWGVYRIAEGNMTMGALVACSILVGRTLAPLSQAVALYVRFQQSSIALHNLGEIMRMPVERAQGQEFVNIKGLKGEVKFDNVSFTYPNAKIESLENISFHIKQGERVGIIGRAGSGKSTLLRLILNLYNPTDGRILMDSLEIRQLDPAELRSFISYAPQDPVMFRGNLKHTLELGNADADDEGLEKAVEMSGVADFSRRHPMGYEMPIDEMGGGLSSGQRQAVGVARAMLRANSNLMVMDDPTSEMDNRSEEWVKQNIAKWSVDKTFVLVTHRATMLELVDRLIVVDYGRIIADGPKNEVLNALKSGHVQGRR